MNQNNTIPKIAQLDRNKIRQKGSIIYIDDKPSNRELIKERIEKAGYRIKIIQEILEVIPILSLPTINADLIFLNMNMLAVNGYQILNQLNDFSHLQNTKIIALVQNKSIGNLLKAKQPLISDFLIKPFTPEQIYFQTAKYFLTYSKRNQQIDRADKSIKKKINPQITVFPNSNSSKKSNFQSSPQYLKQKFITLCQQELLKFIGPIATIVCQEILANNPHINAKEFINKLKLQIPNPKKARQFEENLLIYFLPTIDNTD
ncbi:MAG: two-component system response regulator [Prochloraceae cyanobacterium]